MSKEITKQFKEINAIHRSFEDFGISYESLLEKLDDVDNAKNIIKLISGELKEISDFPGVIGEENIKDEEIEVIRKWIDIKCDKAYEMADEDSLPDVLNYSESIVIKGIDGSEIIFKIDEITISHNEGSEEFINIYLSNGQEEIARGYIKLTVGYLNFDEDGGAADGTEDNIEYEYHKIAEKIDNYILEQSKKHQNESKIVEIIETAMQ